PKLCHQEVSYLQIEEHFEDLVPPPKRDSTERWCASTPVWIRWSWTDDVPQLKGRVTFRDRTDELECRFPQIRPAKRPSREAYSRRPRDAEGERIRQSRKRAAFTSLRQRKLSTWSVSSVSRTDAISSLGGVSKERKVLNQRINRSLFVFSICVL